MWGRRRIFEMELENWGMERLSESAASDKIAKQCSMKREVVITQLLLAGSTYICNFAHILWDTGVLKRFNCNDGMV